VKIEPKKTHLLKEFKHDAPLLMCKYDSTGRFVFAGGRDQLVHRWEIATGKKISLEGHETWVCAMAGWKSAICTADYAGRVICWSLAADLPKVKWKIEAHQGTVRSVAVSPDGELLATGGKDGKVRLWSTDTGKPVGELSGHAGQVYCVAFHPRGRHLASGDRFNQKPTVRIWDVENQRETVKLDAVDLSAYRRGENVEWGGVRDLAFSPDGSTLACCGRHKYAGPATVLLFNHRTGKQTEKLVSTFKAIFNRVALHPNGFLIATGGAIKSGELWFWNSTDEKPTIDKAETTSANDREPLATIELAGPASCFDLHPDGKQIVVAQSSGNSTYPDGGMVGLYAMATQESATEDDLKK
jgi:WD40 repeat protein